MGRLAALALTTTLLACAATLRPAPPPGPFPMATLWTTPVGESIEGDLAADDRHVYVATRDGTVRALDRDTGAEAWKSLATSPRVVSARAGTVVARGLDGSVASLLARDGTSRWSVATGVKGDLPALVADDMIVVAGEGVVALDASTGRKLWALPPEGVVSSPPVLVASCLALGEADGTLRCRDPRTGASRWALKTRSALQAPPVSDAAGHLVLGTTDRRVLSLDPGKGGVRWRWKVGADVQRAAAARGERVLVAAFDAVLYALNLGNGNLAWRAPLPSRPLSSPMLVQDTVLVACHENEIVGFDLKTGRRLGGLKTSELMRTPPVLSGSRLFLGLRSRAVQALALPPGTSAEDTDLPPSDATSEAP